MENKTHRQRSQQMTPAQPVPSVQVPAGPMQVKQVTRHAVPAKSLKKAATVFQNFSPSRFSAGSRPKNFVPSVNASDPKAVQTQHRDLMVQQIAGWKKVSPVNPGMTIALPTSALAQLFRSFSQKTATIDLTDLLSVLRRRMSGTEFYTAGAPPLIQSAALSQRQAQVQQIIDSIKKGQLK